jgi:hypothetical protein
MCTIFTGFLYVKSSSETSNLLRGTAIFRTGVDDFEEIVFKKFCGLDGDDRDKFQVNQIIQAVGRFALEGGSKYVCIDVFIFLKKITIKNCLN